MKHVLPTKEQVAETAANLAQADLKAGVEANGSAVWVLAGGATPVLAYANMAERFASDAFWAGVTLIIGDEPLFP